MTTTTVTATTTTAARAAAFNADGSLNAAVWNRNCAKDYVEEAKKLLDLHKHLDGAGLTDHRFECDPVTHAALSPGVIDGGVSSVSVQLEELIHIAFEAASSHLDVISTFTDRPSANPENTRERVSERTMNVCSRLEVARSLVRALGRASLTFERAASLADLDAELER